jgi:hypothetical protein
MALVLNAALSKLNRPDVGGAVDSLSIVRLIDYPRLSQAMAAATRHDRAWDVKSGKPPHIDINAYAAKMLSGKDITTAFDETLAKGGYRIRNASMEKVLVGRLRDVPLYRDDRAPGLVPYDAQVWFRLGRKCQRAAVFLRKLTRCR